MDADKFKALREKCKAALPQLQRFRWPLILLLVGLALLSLPVKKQTAQSGQAAQEESLPTLCQIQNELTALLESIDGAGRVELMLTLASGEETVYLFDESADEGRTERTAVFSQTGSSEKHPVAVRHNGPVFRGAAVVCEGADKAAVRLAVTQAVSRLTGLGSDKITVIKMKGQQEETT